MRFAWLCVCAAAALMAAVPPDACGATPVGTGFSYQGRLVDDGIPYDGTVNIEFRLYDAGGTQIGSPSIHNGVLVTRGLFTISDVNGAGQFGASAFNGEARKLGIAVNGTAMSPVPFCTAVPYALYALNGGGSGGSCVWTASGSIIYNGNSGNVGIGTAAPVSKLHVEGATTGDVIVTIHNTNDAGTERLYFGTSSASDAAISVWGSTNATTPGKFRFTNNKTSANYDWTTNGSVRMTLDNGGNLGIGTASPAAKLHISGGSAIVEGNLGLGTTAPAARLHVINNAIVEGLLGIGTTSPAFKLHVEGTTSGDVTAAVNNTNSAGSQSLYFGTSISSDAVISVSGSTHAATPGKFRFVNNKTSANYDWVTNGSVRMTLDNGGDLGIGTASPAFKLHVEGSTFGEVAAAIHNLNNVGNETLYFGTSSASDAAIQVWGSTHATAPGKFRFINNKTSANYDWVASGNIRMTLDSAGNLGIGTASPAGKFHVGDGDVYVDDYASSAGFYGRRAEGSVSAPAAVGNGVSLALFGGAGYDGSAFSGIEAYMEILSAEAWTTTAHGATIRFIGTPAGGTASYEYMRISDDGNVGIGTNVPQTRLDVAGGSDASLSGGGYVQVGTASGASLAVDDNEIMARNNGAVSPLYLNQDGGDVLINGNGAGKVGIGTNSPGGRLHVVGTTGYGIRTQTTGEGGIALFAYGGPSGYAADFRGNVRIWDHATNDLVIELGTGLDYAEGFDVADAGSAPAGTVLVIDPQAEGQLKVSHRAYDTCVAGIVAGAKGLGSGVRLGCGRYDRDVALAGRVYCNVDATAAGVEAGDLLTTSETPGYAMKAGSREKAQGAILGKAMQRLEKGRKAQILVLVTLQ
jgi:hypothetical protein